ncbi:uncharacterized protein LOC134178751 [Corticium candelabrum]|uniref:uncharacterized protein LOC134178751 n=1 Tax=Corticium candelabrum TaxID=121492 RepID=UPI002E2716E5|nr:uncharacterized protein LOC134178751 [Corticium candelabrum]
MWGHSIGDTVCRYEIDNSAIVGYQIWEFFDPIFGSAVVFFRILSGCLYISLAVASSDAPEDHKAGKPYLRSGSVVSNSPINENDKANIVGITEFMMSNRKVRKQTLTIFNEPGAIVTNFYYSAQNDRFHRNNIRSYYGSVVAILFVVVPFVAYDALARHVGKEQESQLKYAVELVINILLIGLNGWFIISRGGCPSAECIKGLFCCKRKDLNETKSTTAKHAECKIPDCTSSQKCGICKCCKVHRCKGLCRFFHIVQHTNVEIPVFLTFTFCSVAFYIALAVVEHGGDRATDITGIVAVILQSVFVFWTALVHNPLKLLRRGNHHHTWNSVFLSLLFATTLGSLTVDIEREHLDHDVHDKSYLRAFAPLLVDFRVHAAILTYSVLSEFFQQRFTEHEMEKKNIFKPVSNERLLADECKCERPGCNVIYCKEKDEVFWKCTEKTCQSEMYCSNCYKELIVKVGFCTKCGDPATCKSSANSRDDNDNNDSTHANSVQRIEHQEVNNNEEQA